MARTNVTVSKDVKGKSGWDGTGSRQSGARTGTVYSGFQFRLIDSDSGIDSIEVSIEGIRKKNRIRESIGSPGVGIERNQKNRKSGVHWTRIRLDSRLPDPTFPDPISRPDVIFIPKKFPNFESGRVGRPTLAGTTLAAPG